MSKSSTLVAAAIDAMKRAYSPYSNSRVGAALEASNGAQTAVFEGSNVENASFGATVCAERVAVWNAVSSGYTTFESLAVASPGSPPWSPCGLCRQVLSEFAGPALRIQLANEAGQTSETTLGELFPSSFGPRQLDKP